MKSFLILALAITSLAASFAQAGNGGGVSGGDTAGMAIALNPDREITTDQLKKVIDSCDAEFAQSVWVQLFGKDFPKTSKDCPAYRGDNSGITERISVSADSDVFLARLDCRSDPEMSGNGFDLQIDSNGDVSFEKNNEFIYGSSRLSGADLKTADKSQLKIPSLTYQAHEADFDYDKFGNKVSSNMVVTSVTLIHGNDPSHGEHLINSATQIDRGISIDLRPLRDCLVNGVAALNNGQ